MKHRFPMRGACLLLCMLLLACGAAAEKMAQLQGLTVPLDTERIDFGRTKVQDYDALKGFLFSLPALRHVDMYATPISGAQADELAELFPGITFGWTLRIRCKDHNHDIRTDATAFSTLHNKRSPKHTSDDFRILKYCKNLLALDIGHNRVTDLDFLYDLPNLRVLILAINEITDITPLASLHDLEYAEIFKNRITDLRPLVNLSKLVDLNIGFNSISDWSPLCGMRGLERLWVYSSSVYGVGGRRALTDQVVSDLRRNLPDTTIDSTHYPTAGGWRDHPRYGVIAQMFKTGVYIPFDHAHKPDNERP